MSKPKHELELCVNIYVDTCFHFSGIYTQGSEIAGSYATSVVKFSKYACILYICISLIYEVLLLLLSKECFTCLNHVFIKCFYYKKVSDFVKCKFHDCSYGLCF